jgi:hypothetical protein
VLSVEDVMTITGNLPITEKYPSPDGITNQQTSSSSGIAVLVRPSIAFDGFIWKHLSIGLKGSLGASTSKYESITSTNEGVTTQTQHNADASVVLSPRLGAAWTSESGFGVWARGMLEAWLMTFAHSSSFAGESYRQSDWRVLFGVRGDLLATYSPAPHVVLTGGPFVSTFIDSEWINPTKVGVSFNAGMFF